MFKQHLILFLIFYILSLCQSSFFVHFQILGQMPNLVLVFLFLIVFLNLGSPKIPWEVIFAGFFTDIFSHYPIGTSIIILFLDTILLKEILKNLKRENIFIFLGLFFVFELCFYAPLLGIDYFLEKSKAFLPNIFLLVKLSYNLIFATIGFFLFKLSRQKILT